MAVEEAEGVEEDMLIGVEGECRTPVLALVASCYLGGLSRAVIRVPIGYSSPVVLLFMEIFRCWGLPPGRSFRPREILFMEISRCWELPPKN